MGLVQGAEVVGSGVLDGAGQGVRFVVGVVCVGRVGRAVGVVRWGQHMESRVVGDGRGIAAAYEDEQGVRGVEDSHEAAHKHQPCEVGGEGLSAQPGNDRVVASRSTVLVGRPSVEGEP